MLKNIIKGLLFLLLMSDAAHVWANDGSYYSTGGIFYPL